MTIPPGTVAGPATATAELLDLQLPPGLMRVSAVGQAIDFTIDSDWSGELELAFTVTEDVLPEDAVVIYYEPVFDRWFEVPSTPTSDGRLATLDHLTVLDIADAASWGTYQIQDVLGNRGEQPDCDQPLPSWVNTVEINTERNATVLACAEERGGRLLVKIVANRGFPLTLTTNHPPHTVNPGASTDIAALIVKNLTEGAARASGGGSYVIVPGQEITFVFEQPGDHRQISITPRPDAYALIAQTVIALIKDIALPGDGALAWFECLFQAANAANGDDVLDVAREGLGAIEPCAEPVLVGMGVAQTAQIKAAFRNLAIAYNGYDLVANTSDLLLLDAALRDGELPPSPVTILVRDLAEPSNSQPETAEVLDWLVVDGIGPLLFGQSPPATALAVFEPLLGPGRVSSAQCPSGSNLIVRWDELSLVYFEDALQGWFYRGGGDTLFETPSGVGLGMSEPDMANTYQGVEIVEASLGREFFYTVPSGTMSGTIENGAVRYLKAGDACVFR